MATDQKNTQEDNGFQPPPFIRGANFTEDKIESARTNLGLLSISLLLSNNCNLNCKYCYRDAGVPESSSLTFQEWENVLRQAKMLGARSVWIPGSGEPLLDPVLCDSNTFPLLELCAEMELSVTFFTNGTMLTKELASMLADFNVSIITKLNSFIPEIQDYLSGVENSFSDIRNGLDFLLEAGFAEKAPSRLGIDTVITNQNYDEIPKLFRFCRERNIIPYITANLHGGRACVDDTLDVSKSKLRAIFEELLEIDRQEYGYDWFPSPPIAASQCKRLFYDIVVETTGNVLLCPGVDMSIGNIRRNSLIKILKSSDLFKKIRNMPNTLNGKCQKCQSQDCSYGCRLEAWANGDLLGEDPMCWHQSNNIKNGASC